MKRRTGFTLIETLVWMVLANLLIGVVVYWLQSLIRAEDKANDLAANWTTLARLTDRFRQDVRASTELRTAPNAPAGAWELLGPDGDRRTYRLDRGELLRTHHCPGRNAVHDVFRLSEASAVEVRRESDARVTLRIALGADGARPLVVEARLKEALD